MKPQISPESLSGNDGCIAATVRLGANTITALTNVLPGINLETGVQDKNMSETISPSPIGEFLSPIDGPEGTTGRRIDLTSALKTTSPDGQRYTPEQFSKDLLPALQGLGHLAILEIRVPPNYYINGIPSLEEIPEEELHSTIGDIVLVNSVTEKSEKINPTQQPEAIRRKLDELPRVITGPNGDTTVLVDYDDKFQEYIRQIEKYVGNNDRDYDTILVGLLANYFARYDQMIIMLTEKDYNDSRPCGWRKEFHRTIKDLNDYAIATGKSPKEVITVQKPTEKIFDTEPDTTDNTAVAFPRNEPMVKIGPRKLRAKPLSDWAAVA